MQIALLRGLLLPLDRLKAAETALDVTTWFVITDELKDLPFGAVWAKCRTGMEVPTGRGLIGERDSCQQSVSARG